MIDILTVFLAAVFFIYIGYRPPWFSTKISCFKSKEIQDIPGPLALPILGTSWLFTIGKYEISKIPEYYREMRDRYGPIFKEEALCNVPVINIFDKADIEKVFRSTGKYPLRPPTAAIAKYRSEHPDKYASTGLANEQGEKWHFLRTSLTSALTMPKTIQGFLPQMEEVADDWCYLIKQKRDKNGNIPNLEDLAGRLALEGTCALVLDIFIFYKKKKGEAVLDLNKETEYVKAYITSKISDLNRQPRVSAGRRMGFLIEDQTCETAQKLANAVQENFIACRDTYFGLPLWQFFPTPAYKRLCESEIAIYHLASEIIRTADDSTRESAVFQSVLKAQIDDREKRSAIVDFLAAGIHTLKNSLLFLLYQVAMNPECQEKIIKDTTKAYLKACSLETFRLSPTVNCLARITETDLDLSGYHVNAGSVVVCHTALACQNENNFKEAKKFRPERWLNEEKNQTASSATFLVTPFGYGKRICPGKRFIEQVLPVILDKLVKSFKITVEKPLELEFEFLVSPKGHVSMNFEDRI